MEAKKYIYNIELSLLIIKKIIYNVKIMDHNGYIEYETINGQYTKVLYKNDVSNINLSNKNIKKIIDSSDKFDVIIFSRFLKESVRYFDIQKDQKEL